MSNFKNRLNAVKHGLLAKEAVLQSEVRPFNKMARQLLAELKPESTLEILLAEQVIMNYWRLKRFLKLENDVFLSAEKPRPRFTLPNEYYIEPKNKEPIHFLTDFIASNPSFDLLLRYNASILRSFYRSINEYKSLKGAENKKNTGKRKNKS